MSAVPFDKVVPFGQDFVFDDMLVTFTFKEWVTFFLCLIDSSVDRCENREPLICPRSGSLFAGLFDGVKHSSAPHPGNLREESVLNGIPLGAVRRIVGNPDIDAKLLGGLNETPFELPTPCVVRTAAITENEYALCVWIYMSEMLLPLFHETVAGKLCCIVADSESHISRVSGHIIDAMRYHLAIGERGIVVVICLHWLRGIGTAAILPEVSEDFLLLCVHAEDRDSLFLALLPEPLNVPELLVTQFTVCHRKALQGLAACIALHLYDLAYGIEAYIHMVLLGEYTLYLRRRQAQPLCIGILRKPCGIELHNLTENSDILGMDVKCILPATSLFADSAIVKMLFGVEFATASIDGVTGYTKDATDKFNTMPAIPFCNDSDELSCLSLIRVPDVLRFFVCYYICWIIRYTHNCLEISCKGTNFSADLRI